MRTFARKSKKTGAGQASRVTPASFAAAPAGCIAIRQALNGKRLQTKLKVGAPNDAYEREADRVADQVMRMVDAPEQHIANGPESVQRVCEECEQELQRQPMEEEEELLQTKALSTAGTIQRKIVETEEELPDSFYADSAVISRKERLDGAGFDAPDAPELQGAAGEGKSLPSDLRQRLEPAYGHSFADVRIHDGSRSAELSRRLNARAFTYRNNIFFGAGENQLSDARGKHLLAHELTHVVQQGYAPRTTARSKSLGPTRVMRKTPGQIMRQACVTTERSIDSGIPIADYNCTGLAFRDYSYGSPTPKLNALLGPVFGQKPCAGSIPPNAIKLRHWTYTFQNTYETASGTVVASEPSHPDYHIVGGRADCDSGADLANVYSKNGGGPISGPDLATSHRLADRQFRGRVVVTPIGPMPLNLYTNRTGVTTTCYAAAEADLAP